MTEMVMSEKELCAAGSLGILQTLAAERQSHSAKEALLPFANALGVPREVDGSTLKSMLLASAEEGDAHGFLQTAQTLLSAIPCWSEIEELCLRNVHLLEEVGVTLEDMRDVYRFMPAERHALPDETLQCMASSALGQTLIVSVDGKLGLYDVKSDTMKRIVETLDEVHWVFMDAQGISWPITRESKSYVGLDADGNICGEVDITAKLEGDNIAACRGCAMGDLHCLIVRLGEGYRIAAYHPDSTAEKAFLFPQEQFVAPVSLTGFGGFLYVVDSMGFLHIVDVRKGVDRSSLVKCLPVEQGVVRLAATSRGVFVASTSWVGKMSHEGQWMYRYPLKALGESAGSIEMMQFSLCVGSEYKLYISERRSKELLSFVV